MNPTLPRQARGGPAARLRRAAGSAAVVALLSVLSAGSAVASAVAPARNVAQIWTELCANCHGAGMQGTPAPSMLDDVWLHGDDDDSLARSIRQGWATSGMPAFGAALNEDTIRSLVVYIRETRAQVSVLKPPRGSAQPITELAGTVHSELQDFRVEVVADGLERPWGIAFLPDQRLLVTERPGRLRIIEPGRGAVADIAGLPPIYEKRDGGLMDVELHPHFAENGWVYLAFSELGGSEPGASSTRIIRGRLREGQLVDQQDLFRAPPALYWADDTHFGARFVFDEQGYLYFTIGDRGHMMDAQDLASPYGKLHRIHDDGRIPADNPFVDRPGAVPSIWSYGHRNAEGLTIDPATHEIWSTEHGPRGGDELNVIAAGHNYGWPVITHGIDYDGTPITDHTAQEGMEQPVVHWTPSIAVCAVTCYTGARFPRWQGQLFVTALAGQELRRVEIRGHTAVHQEVLFKGYGRVRDVVTGPDGLLYVALNDPGLIVRLVPVE